MKRTLLLLTVIFTVFSSCHSRLNKALKEIGNIPSADYSYVVEPIFKETKETAESKTKSQYNADEVKIGAVGFHKYDPQTKTQKDQVYRLQVVLVNSKSNIDFKNEIKMNDLGREIAEYVVTQIANNDKYSKIEVTFIIKEHTTQNILRQNIFYKLPDFQLTQMFD